MTVDRETRTGRVDHGDVVIRFATQAEEPDVRRLLREIPLGGEFQITLEREPDALAGYCGLGGSHYVLIGYDRASGEAAGMGELSIREMYVDGAVRQVPYFSGLRVRPGFRRRIGAFRQIFGMFKTVDAIAESVGFASITSDNSNARRLLEAGLPGLPVFRPLWDFSTFVMKPRRAAANLRISRATREDYPLLASFLQRCNARFQLSEVWSAAALDSLREFGLLPHNFLIARKDGQITGCLAVWDQRAFKQTVVRKYPSYIRRLRPLINLAAPLLRSPHLPPIGEKIEQITFSHLALAQEDPQLFTDLLDAGLDDVAKRGGEAAVIGFASDRPLREALMGRFKAVEYRTSLCVVFWPEAAERARLDTGKLPHPELALL